jgi:hypothetical protein
MVTFWMNLEKYLGLPEKKPSGLKAENLQRSPKVGTVARGSRCQAFPHGR